ncbi:MAG: hypothetical protein ACFCGT_20370 [Sandaracinaceae bacterium]
MRRSGWPLALVPAALFAFACGSPPPEEPAPSESTGGGDERADASAPALRTTVPVPVPTPPVEREALSDALRSFWTGIEETVAIRPPAGPSGGTQEAIEAWAYGPFKTWFDARTRALERAALHYSAIPEEPAYEQAVAAGLYGYAFEDFVADVRGAPITEEIERDPEQLRAYDEALRTTLQPLAVRSAQAYSACVAGLEPLGDDAGWGEWREYCRARGRDVIEVYRIDVPPSAPAPEEEPSDAGAHRPRSHGRSVTAGVAYRGT